MENLEEKLLRKVLRKVMYDYCDTAHLSITSKSLELFDNDGFSKNIFHLDTEEETLSMANVLFNYGISIKLDDSRVCKIIEDKNIVPLCKED